MKISSAVLIYEKCHSHQRFLASISSVQSLSHVQLFATPWIAAHQVHHQLPELAQTLSIESVMPSKHLILCCPLLLLPSSKTVV